jgi:hydrogenase nickel incorporation protein HypB
LIFSVSDVVIINKIDVLPYFDFDMEKCVANIRMRNPNAKIISVCARTGEGVDQWVDWLCGRAAEWRNS